MTAKSRDAIPPPPDRRRKVLLLSSGERADLAAEARRLAPLIAAHAEVELADLDDDADLGQVEFDLAMVVGGDGSILQAVYRMGRRQRPVVGVNLGKLGFLADLSPDEFCAHLAHICSGELPVIKHLMLECTVRSNGRVLYQQLLLNEVTVFAGPPFAILDVDLYVDSESVTTYSCDGLILSTPVGSTAHSLSAGGPILRQDLQAVVVSPISPHTLTNRPVVDSADRIYEIVAPAPHPGTTLVVDGRVVCQLERGHTVRVEKAEPCFQLVSVPGHSYYRTLREKLGWGGKLKLSDTRRSLPCREE